MRSLPLTSGVVIALSTIACRREGTPPEPPPGPPVLLASGVEIRELREGVGEPPTDGDWLAFHYDARIVSAAEGGDAPFDSTRSGDPFFACLGRTPLLPGLTEGLRGMKEGGRRRITIPPAQGYGALGKPPVPPDATLRYDVELVDRFERLPSGLQLHVVREGAGEPPKSGDRVSLDYRLFLVESGRELSSSRMLGRALDVELGKGTAIPALEEALPRMKPKARWILAVPPELGYGVRGTGMVLLPGQDVLLDVELLGLRPR
jgi:FKBP-type peptidyl-prolyl cis-trans isomerase